MATTTAGTPMALTVDTSVCVYIVYDLNGSSGLGTMGKTIDFEITNPSVDIIVSAGTVIPNTTLNIDGVTMIAVDNVAIVRDAPPVSVQTTNPACSNSIITSMMSVHMDDAVKDPTLYYLQNCAVWKKEGNADPHRLNNPNFQIRSLTFKRIDLTSSKNSASSSPKHTNMDNGIMRDIILFKCSRPLLRAFFSKFFPLAVSE